jgi:hypothetical protein
MTMTSALIWLAALYWLGVFLLSLAVCRRLFDAAATTVASMAVAYFLSFWRLSA